MPKPRKLIVDSLRITAPRETVNTTIDGRPHLGQDVAEEDPPGRAADGPRRLHVRVLPDAQNHAAYRPDVADARERAEDDDHLHHPLSQ